MSLPNARVLQRLIYLDAELRAGQLRISHFARDYGVAQKTIRRDLDLITEIGFELVYDTETYCWGYEGRGVGLFSNAALERVGATVKGKAMRG